MTLKEIVKDFENRVKELELYSKKYSANSLEGMAFEHKKRVIEELIKYHEDELFLVIDDLKRRVNSLQELINYCGREPFQDKQEVLIEILEYYVKIAEKENV